MANEYNSSVAYDSPGTYNIVLGDVVIVVQGSELGAYTGYLTAKGSALIQVEGRTLAVLGDVVRAEGSANVTVSGAFIDVASSTVIGTGSATVVVDGTDVTVESNVVLVSASVVAIVTGVDLGVQVGIISLEEYADSLSLTDVKNLVLDIQKAGQYLLAGDTAMAGAYMQRIQIPDASGKVAVS